MAIEPKEFLGLDINIENPAGTYRRGFGWKTLMRFHYGEILGTEGVDGDPIDIFIPPHAPTSTRFVYVIHQRNPKTKEYDEDKIIAGVPNIREAMRVYSMHYDKPNEYIGPITKWSIDDLMRVLRETRGRPGKLDGSKK